MKKTFLSLLLAVLMILSMSVTILANDSTTTGHTAAKDFGHNTEIYAVTERNYGDYPYYGAKYEPTSGCYYGRVLLAGDVDGHWGVVNKDALAGETAVAFYTSLEDKYSVQYWSYLYGKVTADGNHALLIDLNFNKEADSCKEVLKGTYDEKIKEDFAYLNTLNHPVFVRIAGEVNVWTNAVDASTFIKAYRRVADIAHKYGPNVALVFSPNYSSAYRIDMDTFYPGDAYVDWVGVSLYYNQYAHNGDTKRDEFYGVGKYGDPVLDAQQAVNLSKMHKKPLMVTEGGSFWTAKINNKQYDCTSFAADRVKEAFAFLTAVHQNIKCIIYSDTNFGSSTNKYSISQNETVSAAFDAGVESNPSLIKEIGKRAQYYTKIGSLTAPISGNIKFIGYSYSQDKLSAKWYIDGTLVKTVKDYPYTLEISTSDYSAGRHEIKVEFSSGNSKKGYFTIDVPTKVEKEDPTCLKDGHIEAWRCGEYYYTDESCTVQYTDEEFYIPSPGHLWEKTDEVEATDITYGYVKYECTACKEEKTEYTKAFFDKFNDTGIKDYYYTPVMWAVKEGITTGTSSETFSPDANCTRGQAVTFLWRAVGSPEPEGVTNPFKDVKESDYFYKAVLWAIKNNITLGTSQTTFSPDAKCTRGQIVTFLWRSAGNPETESESNPFKDVKSGDYFYSPVLWAVEKGITTGTSNTTFSPSSYCTRGQIVTFLYRHLYVPEE